MLDDSMIKLLGMTEHMSLEISTDGQAIVIVPIADEQRTHKFAQALQSTNKRYGQTLRRLAE